MSTLGNQPDSLEESTRHNSQDRIPNPPTAPILPIVPVLPVAATHVPSRPLHITSDVPALTHTPTIIAVAATEIPTVYPTSSPSFSSQFVPESSATPIQSITSPTERTLNATSSPVSVPREPEDHPHVLVIVCAVLGVVLFTFGIMSIIFWLRQRRRAHARLRETTQFVAIPASRLSFRRKNQEFGGIGASPANYVRHGLPSMSTVTPLNPIARANMAERNGRSDLSGLPVAQLHMSMNRSRDDTSQTLGGSIASHHKRNISDIGSYESRHF